MARTQKVPPGTKVSPTGVALGLLVALLAAILAWPAGHPIAAVIVLACYILLVAVVTAA